MNLQEELKYLGAMLDKKLISTKSVGERLQELAQREKDRPLIEISELLSRALSGYSFYHGIPSAPLYRLRCDCGVLGCTYPTFKQRHDEAIAFTHTVTGYWEPPMPASHVSYMKYEKEKLEKRKDEAKNRADQNYAKAKKSIDERHRRELKEAEELK